MKRLRSFWFLPIAAAAAFGALGLIPDAEGQRDEEQLRREEARRERREQARDRGRPGERTERPHLRGTVPPEGTPRIERSFGRAELDYDIVYIRQPRYGDERRVPWPEVATPTTAEPGADLVLLRSDGTEEVLVECGACAITDPMVSFDGKSILYAKYFGRSASNRRRGPGHVGADIYRMDLATRNITKLTDGGRDPSRLGPEGSSFGVFNLGPMPLPGGRIAFTSNRYGLEPPRGITEVTMQIFVMDEDGRNVEPVAPMTNGSALHPTILMDGRMMFSTLETQGLRDRRVWGLWSIYPDGRHWEPLVSAFDAPIAYHFQTQLSGGDLVVIGYYNQNNQGFGQAFRFPVPPEEPAIKFHSAFDGPRIDHTFGRVGWGERAAFTMPFTPHGFRAITTFTHRLDHAASCPGGVPCHAPDRMGKVTHPSAAPNDDLLVVWSPGPSNDLQRPINEPAYDGGIYLIAGGETVGAPEEMLLVRDDPEYNEAWPRAVLPYRAIYGVEEPVEKPWLPKAQRPELVPGAPFGLIGTSSFYKRETFPSSGSDRFDGLDAFYRKRSSNWVSQGADAGKYGDEDVWAVRILAMEPNPVGSGVGHAAQRRDLPDAARRESREGERERRRPQGEGREVRTPYLSHAAERLRILGEVPLRHNGADGSPRLDAEGNPDTSFLAKIPADTPFTFQTIDRNGLVLNMSQTWHQVRPGEMRADCGGCHAHSQEYLPFEGTAASGSEYEVLDLAATTPLITRDGEGESALRIEAEPVVDVEFLRDVRPILQRSCIACHTGQRSDPPGQLVLDDLKPIGGLPGDYKRLADDGAGRWGYSPVEGRGWSFPNASRYVRMFQSRRSLLAWKVFGERLDGWTNEDHPTESVPGDPATLPPGARSRDADLDFDGEQCPPPGSGVPPLSADERMTIARWIDLGAPISLRKGNENGWFRDDLRPILHVELPRTEVGEQPPREIRFGVFDAYSGLVPGSVSVKANFAVNGRAAGSELASAFEEVADGVWSLPVPDGLPAQGRLTFKAKDRQGNRTTVEREFSSR